MREYTTEEFEAFKKKATEPKTIPVLIDEQERGLWKSVFIETGRSFAMPCSRGGGSVCYPDAEGVAKKASECADAAVLQFRVRYGGTAQ